VYNLPFERWIRDHGDSHRGTFQLLVANPPYGPRGSLIAEDADKEYRVKQAYLYFLLRGLDLLAADQLARLLSRIKPAVFEDILDGLTPREPWLPLEVVQAWVQQTLVEGNRGLEIELERDQGLLKPTGLDYEAFSRNSNEMLSRGYSEQAIWFIGWANHHLALFRPPQPREIIDGVPQKVPLDEIRLEVARGWIASFGDWLKAHPELQRLVENTYNQTLREYVAPDYSGETVHIARWVKDGPRLFDYQWQAARRILSNRCGLLAFDVGLGKTYTGLAILARARQEGWARRPVILVPNSIVWKWYRDLERCLPDYKVLVVGSKRKVVASGRRKGRLASETDTPRERAEKWSAFQAGQADVVLRVPSARVLDSADCGLVNPVGTRDDQEVRL